MGVKKGFLGLMKRHAVHQRRAMTLGTLLMLIITILGGFVLITVGYQIYRYIGEGDDVKRCTMSLFHAHEMTKIKKGTIYLIDIIPNIDCKAKKVEIQTKSVTLTGKSTGAAMRPS